MLAVIAVGFAWVIWLEYFVGAWVWKIVLVAGLLICLVTFAPIGVGHVLARRVHARFGARPAYPLFLLAAIGLYAWLVSAKDLLSGVLGIMAIMVLWDGIEMLRQEKREQREDQR
ncbi:MAG TPA: DUF4491 family protein [Anaerolineales bacterium]|nr:DUF4491 family protein [Anaerolineales bacterium]